MNENDLIFERYSKKDQVDGGKADNMSCEDIAKRHGVSVDMVKSEMKMGVKVEMEHTKDKNIAREIAHDHLFEFPDYYTALAEMEDKLKKKWKKK